MKALIYLSYGIVGGLILLSIYMASKVYDGLVEPDYYGQSTSFFSDKEREEALGLSIRIPAALHGGDNDVIVEVMTNSGPLLNATAVLYLGRMNSERSDIRYALEERAPGRYGARIVLPFKGKALMRIELEVDGHVFKRRRFVEVQ